MKDKLFQVPGKPVVPNYLNKIAAPVTKTSTELTPMNIGVPLIYEGYYVFDKPAVLKKANEFISGLSEFENLGDLELGDAGSSASEKQKGPHTWPELQGFVEWSYQQANKILQEWGFYFDGLLITDSWMNRHRKGGWTNYHTHQLSDIVLAAYVSAPPNSGNLIMVDPLENHWMGFPTSRNFSIQNGFPIPVKDNKVVFFAPFLRHATQKSETDEERWVISMNISTIRKGQNK